MNDVTNAFSPYHHYKYIDKPVVLSALDVLSSPIRKAFGGRTIDLEKQLSGKPMMTAAKVATLFVSFVFFPVAFICLSALLVKVVYCVIRNEEKRVKEVVRDLKEIHQQAEKLANEGKVEKLVEVLDLNPHVIANPQVSAAIHATVSQKIKENISWQILAPLLQQVSTNERFALVVEAVKQRFEQEDKQDVHLMNADQIVKLVEEVFAQDQSNQIDCYKKILEEELKLHLEDDGVHSLFKIDMMDGLISKIVYLENAHAKDVLEELQAKMNEHNLRLGMIPIKEETLHFVNLMSDQKNLKEIHRLAELIRGLHLAQPTLEKKIKVLVEQCNTPDTWRSRHLEWGALIHEIERTGDLSIEDNEIKKLLIDCHRMFFDAVENLWTAKNGEELLVRLNAVVDQMSKQLDPWKDLMQKKKMPIEGDDRAQAILQARLKLAYFEVHTNVQDAYTRELVKNITTWFEEKTQA